jgi:hypothetical protein
MKPPHDPEVEKWLLSMDVPEVEIQDYLDMDPPRTARIEKWLLAAERGDIGAVIDFLESGMDVNAVGPANSTALMRAVCGGHVELIRMLLDRGAFLSPRNTLGDSALSIALILSRPSWGNRWFIPDPDSRALEVLLAAGARYELREAVLLNDVDLARVRLEEGADPNEGEWTYHGPLLKIAAELGYVALVDLLLKYGANIEATDDLAETALLSAAYYGQAKVVCCLLDHGAEIDAIGWSGGSALAHAAIEGHRHVFDLLLSRGAESSMPSLETRWISCKSCSTRTSTMRPTLIGFPTSVNASCDWRPRKGT